MNKTPHYRSMHAAMIKVGYKVLQGDGQIKAVAGVLLEKGEWPVYIDVTYEDGTKQTLFTQGSVTVVS